MRRYILVSEIAISPPITFPDDDNAIAHARNFAIDYLICTSVYRHPAQELLAEFNRYGERLDEGL